MSESRPPLIAAQEPHRPPRGPRWPLVAGLILVAVAAAVAGALLLQRSRQAPPTPGMTDVLLAHPALGPERADGPWVSLEASPLRPGANRLVAALHPRKEAAANADGVRAVRLTLTPLVPDGEGAEVAATAGPDGTFVAEAASIPQAGWWRIAVAVDADGLGTVIVPFDLVVPDPNLNGIGAPPQPASDPAAEALYARGLASITGLRTVRFWQTMANGQGIVALSDHAVRAAASGEAPGFTYTAYGGMEAVVIGDRRWSRYPGKPWEVADASQMIDPSKWGDEYVGATSFALGGEMMLGGEPCRLLAFRTPDLSEPRTQVAAWYLWWVAPDDRVLREVMVSRAHYMTNDFVMIDGPLDLAPPEGAGTPVAATPAG